MRIGTETRPIRTRWDLSWILGPFSLAISPSVPIELFQMRSLETMLPFPFNLLVPSALSVVFSLVIRPALILLFFCSLFTLLFFGKLHLIHFLEMNYSRSCYSFQMQA